MWTIVFWIGALLICGLLIFCALLQLLNAIDLQVDRTNAQDAARELNRFARVEPAFHLTLFVLMSCNFARLWPESLALLPLLVWHGRQIYKDRLVLDERKIYYSLGRLKRRAILKLVFYSLLFLFFIVRFILALLETR
jgi:Cornichon protein